MFDGHNDALIREDHALLASGRSGGHLDLPRMRAGGIHGAIFAVFTPSEDENEEPVPRDDGVIEFEIAPGGRSPDRRGVRDRRGRPAAGARA